MSGIDFFFLLSLIVQVFHSVEELSTGFHKKWYLFTLSFKTFLLFEISFIGFWFLVLFFDFPSKLYLEMFFLVLMFANGIQHIVWWGVVKKYVPGLLTAYLHVAVFLVFYFSVIG